MDHRLRSISGKFFIASFSCLAFLMAARAIGQQQKAAPATAKAPQITSVFPAGGERGTTVELEVKGKNLNTVTDLYFARNAGRVHKMEAKGADRLLATVSIDKAIEPGAIELRAVSQDGISNLKIFRVDEF